MNISRSDYRVGLVCEVPYMRRTSMQNDVKAIVFLSCEEDKRPNCFHCIFIFYILNLLVAVM